MILSQGLKQVNAYLVYKDILYHKCSISISYIYAILTLYFMLRKKTLEGRSSVINIITLSIAFCTVYHGLYNELQLFIQ